MKRIRNRRRDERLRLEKLEPRNMLAATVYVDFGDGFHAENGFRLSDADSQSVNGPTGFGSTYFLTTGIRDALNDGIPEDEVQDFLTQVFEEIEHLFEPFDIQVVRAQATNIDDIAASLQSTATNDAYIYVGGGNPDQSSLDMGSAILDEGNLQDNLAFVFTHSFAFLSVGREPGLATQIAKQAAHTFGLHATEASEVAGWGNVMAQTGTDAVGNLTGPNPFLQINRHFAFFRNDLMRVMDHGVSPGMENSFEVLAATVGRNPNGVEYLTATGAEDTIEIEVINDHLINFTINSETQSNIDISNGLVLQMVGRARYENRDDVTFTGQDIDIRADGWDVLVNDKIQLDVRYVDPSDSSGYFYYVRTTVGDDSVTTLGSGRVGISTGAGNDTVYHEGGGAVNTESGDDRIVIRTNQGNKWHDGGSGHDILDLSEMSTDFLFLGLWSVADEGFDFLYGPNGIDEIIGSDTFDFPMEWGVFNNGKSGFIDGPARKDRFITTIVDGNSATLSDELGRTLTTTGMAGFPGHKVYVLETAKNLNVIGDELVQISSEMNWQQGTTDSINHDVVVNALDTLLISNMSGHGRAMTFQTSDYFERSHSRVFFELTGVTNGALHVRTPHLAVHGSDSGTDGFRFPTNAIDYTWHLDSLVEVFGHGGNDGFEFGFQPDGNGGDLGDLLADNMAIVSTNGGTGHDYMVLDDRRPYQNASNGAFAYALNDSQIREIEMPGGPASRNLRVNHDEVELVQLLSNNQQNLFQVDPSPDVIFRVNGNTPGAGDGDSLALIGDVSETRYHVVQPGQGNGVWYFGDAPDADNLVVFDGIEYVAQSDRIAVASQPGAPTHVSVFDATTQTHLFDIQPYGPNFQGGAQVETADMNGDGIADIIVAPGKHRYALVQIYDGRDGTKLAEFHAFDADSPDYFENYTGGVDIAVGNVGSDEAFEIIASTMAGTPDVRVFVASSPLSYELQLVYNPFPHEPVSVAVRIDTVDINQDGFLEIAAVPGPGWRPYVTINSVGGDFGFMGPVNQAGFSGYVPGYLGGFTVASGDLTGDGIPDIILGGANTGSSLDPFSGQYRVFDGANLPVAQFDQVVNPIFRVQAFDRSVARSVSLTTRDFDLDGVIDRVFAVRRDASPDGQIVEYDVNGVFQDSFVVTDAAFARGMELG